MGACELAENVWTFCSHNSQEAGDKSYTTADSCGKVLLATLTNGRFVPLAKDRRSLMTLAKN
jgi:hypothetical protein